MSVKSAYKIGNWAANSIQFNSIQFIHTFLKIFTLYIVRNTIIKKRKNAGN